MALSQTEPRIFVYPNVQITTGGRDEFILGIEQFRDYMARHLANDYFAEYICGRATAGAGDTIVFAFKNGNQWYFVGDALVEWRYKDEEDQDYPWHYRVNAVRLYPRSVGFSELGEVGRDLTSKIQIAPRLTPEQHLRVLQLSVSVPG